MKRFILIIISLLIICTEISLCNNKYLNQYQQIDSLIANPKYINSIINIQRLQILIDSLPKDTPLKVFNNEDLNYLSKDYIIYYEREFHSIIKDYKLLYICITNKDSTTFLEFHFIQINKIWYLHYVDNTSSYFKYLINPLTIIAKEPILNNNYISDNYATIDKLIKTPSYLTHVINEAKKFKEFRINETDFRSFKDIDIVDGLLRSLENKEYKIVNEDFYKTISDDLLNHRVCIMLERNMKIQISFVYIAGKWYIEQIEYRNDCMYSPMSILKKAVEY